MIPGSNFSLYIKSATVFLFLSILGGSSPLFAQQLTHGPIAGGVTSSAARFYVRVDTVANVNIQLSSSNDFAAAIASSAKRTTAENDFAVLIRVDSLMTNTRYYYRAIVNGQPTPEIRQFWTFPIEGATEPFLFTFGSCQQQSARRNQRPGTGRVFTAMARDLPRFFLQIGDWGYPDSTDTATNPTDFFSLDMHRVQASYRAKYDSTYPSREVLRIAPVDYVYDDHDYVNNNASAFTAPASGVVQETLFPPEARLNSIRGYQQLFPGYALANSNGGIWHKFTFGNADFFMLDTRSQRSPNTEALQQNPGTGKYEFAPPHGHSILAGDSTLVGENQQDWLLRELLASKADWKFIVSSVPFNRGLRRAIDTTLALQDSSVTLPGFGTVSGLAVAIGIIDSWVGFPADQNTLLQFVREHEIKNVVVLSGDSHTAGIDDGANAGFPELMAGGLDIPNSFLVAVLDAVGIRIWNKGGQTPLIGGNFFNAYGRVTVFGADSVRLEIVDEFRTVVAKHTVPNGSLPSNISSHSANSIAHFKLSPNYPNPLRATAVHSQTTLRYSLPARAQITVTIYDIMGRIVRHGQKEWHEAGEHTLTWDGKDNQNKMLPSGIYFLSMKLAFQNGQQQIATQKIVLLK
jgi:alkaline phosphatase D